MKCYWCDESTIEAIEDIAYWELPDGTRAIEITNLPSFHCHSCGMVYQAEKLIEEIEDQLLLIDTKKLSKSISYEALMNQPRLLKRNYFKF